MADRIDGAVLDRHPGLKVISNFAVGYDNIDVPAASERGVLVCNTPDVLTNATADHTWALLLAAARRIPLDLARTDNTGGAMLSLDAVTLAHSIHIGDALARMRRIDEGQERWPMARVLIEALAASMLILFLLDAWATVIGPL